MNTTPAEHAHQPLDSAVHRALLQTTIDRGYPAGPAELAVAVGSSEDHVRASLARLAANHGVVLHPDTLDPWVIHPFSTTPTLFYVTNPDRGWWAPCIWCALGVAALVPGPAVLRTVLAGNAQPCEIGYDDGRISARPRLVAHFPIPVARAWDNVHRFCACTLVFDDASAVDRWCNAHGIERGEVLPLTKVAELACAWYGGHLAPDWRKPTANEARAIFAGIGLTSPHWQVPEGEERF